MNDKLVRLQNIISEHLENICTLFTQRPKITIVIRTPWIDAQEGKQGGIVISDDDYDAAIAEINKLRNKAPVGGQGK